MSKRIQSLSYSSFWRHFRSCLLSFAQQPRTKPQADIK